MFIVRICGKLRGKINKKSHGENIVGKVFKAAVMFTVAACMFTSYVGAENKSYIKWVDFKVTAQALSDAAALDIGGYGKDGHVGWIDALAHLGAKYGGDFSRYKKSDLSDAFAKLSADPSVFDEEKYYSYYRQAYGAVLSGWLGEYYVHGWDGSLIKKYGIKAFSPIAGGYYYSDYDDFGVSRSYGYRRQHLGHDMLGSVGTPIIAMESGYVEAVGWNMYGGWRIGIRSFDGLRYYYYAHLRKDHPYCGDIKEGETVYAGQVIGYLGMTGYSTKKNVNNINVPHLHVGMQLIFDPCQKDGVNQIWIDMYAITNFLSKYRSYVCKGENGEYKAKNPTEDFSLPD